MGAHTGARARATGTQLRVARSRLPMAIHSKTQMPQGIAHERDRPQLAAVPDDLSKIVFATGANPGAQDVKDQTPPVPAGQAMMVS